MTDWNNSVFRDNQEVEFTNDSEWLSIHKSQIKRRRYNYTYSQLIVILNKFEDYSI